MQQYPRPNTKRTPPVVMENEFHIRYQYVTGSTEGKLQMITEQLGKLKLSVTQFELII